MDAVDYNYNMNLEYIGFHIKQTSFTKAINTSVLCSCQHFILIPS